jgi:lipopolysaccharide/colanic/teichoic acid biosynthesis glycosyltransferase
VRLVVTGASGFVGRQLIPLLATHRDVLAVSRDPAFRLSNVPRAEVCTYEDLSRLDLRGSTFLHLAVRNNDRPGTEGEFRAANVDFLLRLVEIAKAGGARRFVNLASTHALETCSDDPYGASKREGARAARDAWRAGVVNLYVPAIYGENFQGRLRFLGRLPKPLRSIALSGLRLFKPTISIDTLHAAVLAAEVQPLDPADPWSNAVHRADPVPPHGVASFLRRALDIAASVTVLVLFGWAMLLIALWVRLDSDGPAIFAQTRVGLNGRTFTCYKFRTMSQGTAHEATHLVSGSAVTQAGAFLRRTKLDELPQVFNLLRNEMALVGPRPCLTGQIELVARRTERGVMELKPGITGIAQINDIDMSDPSKLAAWDDRYRAFRTLAGDVAILWRTVTGSGKGDRVAGEAPR